MSFILGQNCHVILSHADIDAGADYGFLCPLDDSPREAGVQIIREVITPDPADPSPRFGTSIFCHFDILCADDAINPDGTPHNTPRSTDYAKLILFLDKMEGINLTAPIGVMQNLGSLGWSADERHFPKHSIIKCQLNNVGHYYPPVDPDTLALCVWGQAEVTGGPFPLPAIPSMLCDSGYWR